MRGARLSRFGTAVAPILRARLALLLLVALPLAAARADAPSLGVVPAVVLDQSTSAGTVRIAGETATALVTFGPGLLGGTDPLPLATPRSILHLLLRNADGRWRLAQNVPFDGVPSAPFCLDVDGDSLQDVVVPTPLSAGQPFLLIFRQNDQGRLQDPAVVALPDSVQVTLVTATGVAGRTIVLGWLAQADGLWAGELDGSPGAGFHLAWERSVRHGGLVSGSPVTWVPGDGSGSAVVASTGEQYWPAYYSVRLDDGVLTETALPYTFAPGPFVQLDRGHGPESWQWGPPADSLYRITLDEHAKVILTGTAIQGVPSDWTTSGCTISSQCLTIGNPPVIVRAGAHGNCIAEVGFVRLDPDGTARWIDRWEHTPSGSSAARTVGLLQATDGSIQMLHDVSGALCTVSGSSEPPPVDVPGIQGDNVVAYTDLTGDGIPDLVCRGAGVNYEDLVFSRGVPGPPWFLPGVVIPSAQGWLGAWKVASDLDGDGNPDLLGFARASSGAELLPMSFDGETLRPWAEASVPAPEVPELVADVDGDGRSDAIGNPTGRDAETHHLYSWGADRRPRPTATLTGKLDYLRGAGDLDGDGRAEILCWRVYLMVYRCDRASGSVNRIAMVPGHTQGFADGSVLNLEGGRKVDFVCSDQTTTEVWSSDGPGSDPHAVVIDGLQRMGRDPILGAADLLANGTRQLILSGGGVVTTVWDPLGDAREEVRVLPEALTGTSLQYEPVRYGDADGDGDPDLLIFRHDGIRILRNPVMQTPPPTRGFLQMRLLSANPLRDPIRVGIRSLTGPRTVALELIDVTGRRLWTGSEAAGSDGWSVAQLPPEWTAVLPSGAYWLRARSGSSTSVLRIARIR